MSMFLLNKKILNREITERVSIDPSPSFDVIWRTFLCIWLSFVNILQYKQFPCAWDMLDGADMLFKLPHSVFSVQWSCSKFRTEGIPYSQQDSEVSPLSFQRTDCPMHWKQKLVNLTICCHWWRCKLPLWQLTVLPVTTKFQIDDFFSVCLIWPRNTKMRPRFLGSDLKTEWCSAHYRW